MDVNQIAHREFLPLFRDRVAAGAELAEWLQRYRTVQGSKALVLGIPRGGVPVAAEVARRLDADLDVVVARKLGSPDSPELAIGAVTADGCRYLNEEIISSYGVPLDYLVHVTAQQVKEARRREVRFRGDRSGLDVGGRVVIVVDDGLATGATMRAAVRSVRAGRPARLIVAVPVGPVSTCADLRREADEVICPYELESFWAVGLYYEHFEPTEDAEVERILREWQTGRSGTVTAV
ncbi:MAG: phosphoribosyltransferase family protein [Chloroflexota bacterium]